LWKEIRGFERENQSEIPARCRGSDKLRVARAPEGVGRPETFPAAELVGCVFEFFFPPAALVFLDGKVTPDLWRWGGLAPWKTRGSGQTSPSCGLPNGGVICPGADFHAGLLPREKAGFPPGFRDPKLALNERA